MVSRDKLCTYANKICEGISTFLNPVLYRKARNMYAEIKCSYIRNRIQKERGFESLLLY